MVFPVRRVLPAVLAAMISTGAARAQEIADPSVVPVQVESCEPDEFSEVPRLLAMELSLLPRRTAGWVKRTAPEVRIRCDGGAVIVQLMEPRTGRYTGQALQRQGTGVTQVQRTAALTIVELMTSRAEQPAPPVPTPEPPAPAPRTPALAPSSGTPPGAFVFLRGAAAVNGGFQPFRVYPGVVLALDAGGRWVLVSLDARYEGGVHSVPAGDIRTDVWSGALSLRVRSATSRVAFHTGVGLRLGAVRFAGTPDDPLVTDGRRFAGFTGGPCISLVTLVRLAAPVFLALHMEGGVTLWTADARVDDRTVLSARGFRFAAGLGLAVQLR